MLVTQATQATLVFLAVAVAVAAALGNWVDSLVNLVVVKQVVVLVDLAEIHLLKQSLAQVVLDNLVLLVPLVTLAQAPILETQVVTHHQIGLVVSVQTGMLVMQVHQVIPGLAQPQAGLVVPHRRIGLVVLALMVMQVHQVILGLALMRVDLHHQIGLIV